MEPFKRTVVLDCETNKIIRPDKLWCIVCKDIDTNEVFKFSPSSPFSGHVDWANSFIEFYAREVGTCIGHNIIAFDMPNVNRILGLEVIKLEHCIDTLVMSRLFRPVAPFKEIKNRYNRQAGHSLEAWGKYLGSHKIEFNKFDRFSEEMLTYCLQDVNLNHLVYLELLKEKEGFSQECIDLEHAVAHMLNQQVENGFYLDQDKAKKLRDDTALLLTDMDEQLQRLFPPVFKPVKNYTLKVNKDQSLSKVSERILHAYQSNADRQALLKPDGSYDLMAKEVFNPQSGDHIAERLQALGWKPKYFTDKGNIKTDKVTLQDAVLTLLEASPSTVEVQCLADYGIVAARHETAVKWLELANGEYGDGRVHGRINPIGAGTHRCSHFEPNMANITRVSTGSMPSNGIRLTGLVKFDKLPDGNIYLDQDKDKIEMALTGLRGAYGWESRDCWSVPEDYVLVGADAAGIQLRALAHYMDDPKYTEALLKEDIHLVNMKAAGISTRAKTKTFIYSWLMGGGDEKIGSIVGVTEAEWDDLFSFATNRKHWDSNLRDYFVLGLKDKGRKADKKTVATIIKGFKTKEQFLNRTPALKRLKKVDMPAAVKQGYLTGLDGRKLWLPNEHLAMSIYLQGFEAVIMKQAMKFYQEELNERKIFYKQCSFTHDEFQVETKKEYADVVGCSMVSAIVRAGNHFRTNCPLDGNYKVGSTWATTH